MLPRFNATTQHGFSVILVAAFAAAAAAMFHNSVGGDSFFCLFFGRDILEHGLPHTNEVTTLGLHGWWIDAQWLAHLALYGLHDLGGWSLSLVVVTAVEALGFALAIAAAHRSGASALRVLMGGLAAATMLPRFTVMRAQAFAWPLLGLALWLIIDDDRRPSRRMWLAVPLVVLWTNLHGSALFGAGLLGLAVLVGVIRSAERRKERLALGMAIGAAALVSPYWLPPYWIKMTTDAGPFVEWELPSLATEPVHVLLAALTFAGLAIARKRMRVLPAVMLLATTSLSMLGVRYGLLFAFGLAAFGPALLEALMGPRPLKARRALPFAAVVSALWLGGVGAGLNQLEEQLAIGFPPEVARLPFEGGNVMATETYGDWLLFERPDLRGRVLVDVRSEVASYDDWVVLIRIDSGQVDLIDELPDVRHLVVDEGRTRGLSDVLARDPRWQQLFTNERVSAWSREDSSLEDSPESSPRGSESRRGPPPNSRPLRARSSLRSPEPFVPKTPEIL